MKKDSILLPLGLGLAAILFLKRKPIQEAATTAATKAAGKIIDFTTDKRNLDILNNLNPQAKNKFIQFIAEIERITPYKVFLTSGYRSDAVQAALHKENPKNAKPGMSKHNFGVAIDLNLVKPGQIIRKSSSKSTWIDSGVVRIADKYGLLWGGEFKNYFDPVHFELPIRILELQKLQIAQNVARNKIKLPANLV